MDRNLIAPCGMNCSLCIAIQRGRRPCSGCLGDDTNKPHHCLVCGIKNCDKIGPQEGRRYCYQCEQFPCRRLEQLDKRYRTKYHMSMVENLGMIRDKGLDEFISDQILKFTCRKCGRTLSVHRDVCVRCGERWVQDLPL